MQPLARSARRRDGTPVTPASTPRPAACVGATGLAGSRFGARAGWRVYVTDDTSVGTMDGELTSAND
ncbi:hypothetical protein [Haloarcula mannanilytica]|uniref:hypothetical protein n=1 Tax=Haloarcula mannanilytica TaxID=2509225 RepID=UPI0010F6EB58|nr:hypothetical protein [Haloarcula mannanilytica]